MEDSIAAYVLGAVDTAEADAIRAHLEGCAACQELVRRLSQAADVLPLGTPAARPSAALRERILAAAARGTAPAPEAPPGNVIQLPRRTETAAERSGPARRRSWTSRLPLNRYAAAVAALALGLVGLGAWNVSLQRQLNQQPAHFQLAGSGQLQGAQGGVTELTRQDLTLITFQGLPQAPTGKVYQVWLIGPSGPPQSAGVFTPDLTGSHTLVINRNLSGVRTIAVTVEAAPNGAAAPSQQPQLAGQVA
ncbi:MAG: anti-sigma factor [Candidatus Dormibacteraeota bacterium]|nr:anti-sigma factor [Candidatus Dormibacteraeota bacterium]